MKRKRKNNTKKRRGIINKTKILLVVSVYMNYLLLVYVAVTNTGIRNIISNILDYIITTI